VPVAQIHGGGTVRDGIPKSRRYNPKEWVLGVEIGGVYKVRGRAGSRSFF